jgi:acylphosphatase
MYRDKIIKISRSKYIEESVEIAILKLDQIFHYKGTYCMVNYRDINGNLDSVVALGISDGIGRNCYKIVSLHNDNIVWDVKNSLPDVSNLIHNERYLYENENSEWFVVYGENNGSSVSRVILPIGEFVHTWTKFINLSDYTEWVYNPEDGKVRLLYDFYNQSEIDKLIDKVRQEVRYVEFESLTPSQIEMLRGPAGSVDNLVVLTEEEYQNLPYKDPNKFYFTYDGHGDLFVYVNERMLGINSHASVSGSQLEISNYPGHVIINNVVRSVLWLSNDEIVLPSTVEAPVLSPSDQEFTDPFYLTMSTPTPNVDILYKIYDVGFDIYTSPLYIENTTVIEAWSGIFDIVEPPETEEEAEYAIIPIIPWVMSSKSTEKYLRVGSVIVNGNIIEDTSGVNTVDENNNWDIETQGTVDDNNILNL